MAKRGVSECSLNDTTHRTHTACGQRVRALSMSMVRTWSWPAALRTEKKKARSVGQDVTAPPPPAVE